MGVGSGDPTYNDGLGEVGGTETSTRTRASAGSWWSMQGRPTEPSWRPCGSPRFVPLILRSSEIDSKRLKTPFGTYTPLRLSKALRVALRGSVGHSCIGIANICLSNIASCPPDMVHKSCNPGFYSHSRRSPGLVCGGIQNPESRRTAAEDGRGQTQGRVTGNGKGKWRRHQAGAWRYHGIGCGRGRPRS